MRGLSIGIGCRAGCSGAAIAALVGEARALVNPEAPAQLFTIADKRDEPGLRDAAARLGLELVFLPRQYLEAAAAGIATPSPAAERRFGLPSVSEAAALAGAGPGARLLLPRMAVNGVTCAIAGSAEWVS